MVLSADVRDNRRAVLGLFAWIDVGFTSRVMVFKKLMVFTWFSKSFQTFLFVSPFLFRLFVVFRIFEESSIVQ